jgi:serine/threonine protein phosphatase PrpC
LRDSALRLLERLRRPRIRHEVVDDGAPADLRVKSTARSHVGSVRKLNEDRLVELEEAQLWAIADGMGGHSAGDIAAQMVADAIASTARQGKADVAAIREAVASVNSELLDRATSRSPQGTSGSTVVTLLLHAGRYNCLWAGDSRAYLYRDGRCRLVSRDHSIVQEMVDAGLLAPAEAKFHPRANVITRAVGVAEPLEMELAEGELKRGDIFLLCSDGLTATLDEEEIEGSLGGENLDEIADGLLAAALALGASDNVSLVLVEAR